MAVNNNTVIHMEKCTLYKQPVPKTNRSIVSNALQYCIYPGALDTKTKEKILDTISKSESKHFLVLFRDARCKFRALYTRNPETNQIIKIYGIGPNEVDEIMIDKFFKYNSGGKCFSVVHTKHLTLTIDAFTIYHSLWLGKRVQLPNKKDMALLI